MSELLGSGLSFPLRVDQGGGLRLVAGAEDVEQSIGVILRTAPGERGMRPEFGCDVHDFVFEAIDAATIGRIDAAVRAALDRWEPRIEVTAIDVDLSAEREGRLDVVIGYRVRLTSHHRSLVHPFYLIPSEEL